ncbi:MAG: hypothetical protein Kow0040_25410 [Thermogutta sp.]
MFGAPPGGAPGPGGGPGGCAATMPQVHNAAPNVAVPINKTATPRRAGKIEKIAPNRYSMFFISVAKRTDERGRETTF